MSVALGDAPVPGFDLPVDQSGIGLDGPRFGGALGQIGRGRRLFFHRHGCRTAGRQGLDLGSPFGQFDCRFAGRGVGERTLHKLEFGRGQVEHGDGLPHHQAERIDRLLLVGGEGRGSSSDGRLGRGGGSATSRTTSRGSASGAGGFGRRGIGWGSPEWWLPQEISWRGWQLSGVSVAAGVEVGGVCAMASAGKRIRSKRI